MNMFESARAMSGTLALCKITQAELAARLGVSQSYIANRLRLLSLSEEAQRLIILHGVSERHARALLRLSREEDRLDLLARIIERGLTVRQVEAAVDAAVDRDAPRLIAKAERQERIDVFRSTLSGSIETLRSLGVDASARTGYYGDKMYITVCISGV